ncbi:hypothetical protein [Enterobacter roggenkampii]|uniref:hypothetical protein n=1 Tax=Enterobacter roggenkampii TaxID=1812935 RepID=UPI001F0A7FF4|nr:hypothetical protein [Enterobacter roggenkampii]
MSTITKESIADTIEGLEHLANSGIQSVYIDMAIAGMRRLLASLEAEPVAWTDADELRDVKNGGNGYLFAIGGEANKFADPRRQMMLYTAPPAPVTNNAEPVAWLWSHRKHPSEVSLVRPEDDERAEGAHWSGWSCQALYAAPPAPAPMKDHQLRELVNELRDIAVEYHGTQQLRERIARTVRAAMLQGADGNSPLIPDGLRLALSNAGIAAPESDEMLAATCEKYIQALVDWVKDRKPFEPAKVVPDGWVMVPVEPTMSQEIAGYRTLTDTGKMSRLMKTRLSNIYRAMLAAAPQQEVKP